MSAIQQKIAEDFELALNVDVRSNSTKTAVVPQPQLNEDIYSRPRIA